MIKIKENIERYIEPISISLILDFVENFGRYEMSGNHVANDTSSLKPVPCGDSIDARLNFPDGYNHHHLYDEFNNHLNWELDCDHPGGIKITTDMNGYNFILDSDVFQHIERRDELLEMYYDYLEMLKKDNLTEQDLIDIEYEVEEEILPELYGLDDELIQDAMDLQNFSETQKWIIENLKSLIIVRIEDEEDLRLVNPDEYLEKYNEKYIIDISWALANAENFFQYI